MRSGEIMDPGLVVVVVLGVLGIASALGVTLVTIVLRGIKGEPSLWPVAPDQRTPSDQEGLPEGPAREGLAGPDTAPPSGEAEPPEWTGPELAGEDLRPLGTHEERHAVPGRARWW
ncbi:hypothetical protein [Sphaerisporangium corydalis]|uniref:Uncharacterized protein n=1 Tax=Sphaerisporangium corydalis TaxID=1441875 RepID=A0ABV9EEJ4_9ACTN|nr:hypothetical protein [Sphaerisporangium corydalis]